MNIALGPTDAETGEALWTYDRKMCVREPQHSYKRRGFAYWRDAGDFQIVLNS